MKLLDLDSKRYTCKINIHCVSRDLTGHLDFVMEG